MLHVRKVDNAAFAFGVGKLLGKSLRHSDKLFNRLVQSSNVGNHSRFVGKEIIIAQSLQLLLVIVMKIFNRGFGKLFILRHAPARHPPEFKFPNLIVKRIPIVKGGLQVV